VTAAERWARVQALFHRALEIEPAGRAAFLARECAGDHALRRDVESLLAADERSDDFIETPAVAFVSGADFDVDALVGRRIGAYRIVRQIGRGGMGAVYLATRDDDAYRKEVALKVLKRGMDTDFFVSRFRQERQILARLDHPNIARLLDGGTTDDRLPYLVMEFVEGTPLDRYCDERRLQLPERLALFLTVCAAVEYAHQRLVVHRDLKPAHVLVTPGGVPKLLDFGIAKLLDPSEPGWDAGRTATSVRMMTPDYASPEQVRGEPATTATDVYALGVLLFQLLTGRRPYRLTTGRPEELSRAICEQEPERPSAVVSHGDSLRRRLSGDLDTILLKAIRKEPERRYASVEQFAADIRRHLDGLPVLARNDTWRYRAGKFVMRHRASAGAAVLVTVTLATGILATFSEAHVARAERARAERRFNDVRALASSFMFEFHDAIAKLPGSTPARELVVRKALTYLDSLSREAASDASLQRELAEAYLRIGHVQGNVFWPNLGDTAGALASYRKALAIERTILAANRADNKAWRTEADTYRALSQVMWGSGDWAGALDAGRKAVTIRERLAAGPSPSPEARAELADGFVGLGDVMRKTGDLQSAIVTYRRAREIFASLASDPNNRRMRRATAITDYKIGNAFDTIGETAASIDTFRSARDACARLAAEDPSSAQAKRDLAMTTQALGAVLSDAGNPAAAIENSRSAVAILEALAAADPDDVQLRANVAIARSDFGGTLTESGRLAEGLASSRAAIAAFDAVLAADPTNEEARLFSIAPYYHIGTILEARGDTAGALRHYHRALTIWQSVSDAERNNPEIKSCLARLYGRLGGVSARDAAPAGAASRASGLSRQACQWYAKSADAWAEIRKARRLTAAEAADSPASVRRTRAARPP